MDDVTTEVAKQYSEYAYPHPTDDLAAAVAAGQIDWSNPALFRSLLWPEGGPQDGYNLLVAGCGTSQAAMLAFTNPGVQVVGVDLSETSLGHQRFLRDKHNLRNLTLYRGDLREVGKLGRQFDLIVSTGVLHHMADPSEGLAALRDVLAPDGALFLMVYGAAGRHGVYMLQDAFRRMGLDQSPEGVAVARQVIGGLPREHPASRYVRLASELQHDTAIVDTFLHPQDRAYTVPELLSWLETNGLEFQAWSNNQFYYPEALIEPPLRARLRALPETEQWAIVESLLALPSNHHFVARHAGRARRISSTDPNWLRYQLGWRPGVEFDPIAPDGSSVISIASIRYPMTTAEMVFAGLIDGVRTIEDILGAPAFSPFGPAEREAFGRTCIDRFWKIGLVRVGIRSALADA